MKRLLMLLLCVSMIVTTFVSCDFHNMDVEFNMGKDEETKENSEIKDGYELIFTSLGDNTCALTEVYVYGNVGDKVLTIPEKSPNGERVVACHVDCIMTSVPIYIPKDIFEKDILGNAEHLTKFEKTQIENFFKYYSLNDPKAQNSEVIRNDWIKKFPFLEKIEGVYVFNGIRCST